MRLLTSRDTCTVRWVQQRARCGKAWTLSGLLRQIEVVFGERGRVLRSTRQFSNIDECVVKYNEPCSIRRARHFFNFPISIRRISGAFSTRPSARLNPPDRTADVWRWLWVIFLGGVHVKPLEYGSGNFFAKHYGIKNHGLRFIAYLRLWLIRC